MEQLCKYQVAYSYMYSVRERFDREEKIRQALKDLQASGQYVGTNMAVENAYTDLVARILGPSLAAWLSWYMWDADFGRSDKVAYQIHGVAYDPKEQSFYQFWNTVSE